MGTYVDMSRDEKVAPEGRGFSWNLFVLSKQTAGASAKTEEHTEEDSG